MNYVINKSKIDPIDSRMIAACVEEQIAPWVGRRFDPGRREADLTRFNEHTTIFLYDIRGHDVRLVPKSDALAINPAVAYRASSYVNLLRDAVRDQPVSRALSIAIDVNDEAPDIDDVPLFTFQKRRGQSNILLPDVDMVMTNYLANFERDSIPYEDKRITAGFSGSSTGGGVIIPMAAVRDTPFPRLRAARFFRGIATVDFRLSNLVQCDDDVRDALLQEGFGTAPAGWREMYENRFAISIDGNGAACSRPALILKSNCVLLKYDSEYVLFYFSHLVDGEHYIGIHRDQDVLEVLRMEQADPGRFEGIARNGRDFAERVFHPDFMRTYTRDLLEAYQSISSG